MRPFRAGAGVFALILGAWTAPAGAQSPGNAGWIDHGGDRGGSRYSSVAQIDRDNVGTLELAWQFRTGDGEGPMQPGGQSGLQVTPILLPAEAGGHLVLCTPFSRIVALNPVNGRKRWGFDPKVTLGDPDAQYKCRGVAQWQDTRAAAGSLCSWRIFFATVDQRLIALDAGSGNPCDDFGDNGTVALAPLIEDTRPANGAASVRTYMPPVISGDTVVIGSSVGAKIRRADAPSGAVRAFDARTGKLLWNFDPLQRESTGEDIGGGNVWTLMSTDEKRGLVYLPTSSAAPNYYGAARPGDNRYANSLVALNAATGSVAWHYQLVHHDVWDRDLPAQPVLFDLKRDQKSIPAVAQLTKQGLLFVFNRENGQPVFGIKELPVPTDGVEGDVLSPTQPYPVAPPPLSPLGVVPDDAWGLTFFDKGACRKKILALRHGDLFVPPTEGGTIVRPGMASSWGSGAFDRERNLFVTNVQTTSSYIRLVPAASLGDAAAEQPMAGLPGGPPAPIENSPYAIERGVPQVMSPFGFPCTQPPWYVLTAVDLDAGTIKWSVPLGTPAALAMLGEELGAPGIGGPIVTAGGLIFIGATADEKFRAFDIETGDKIWETDIPTAAMATPMTYSIDGRQFVVIAAGGHHAFYRQKLGDYLLAFALPQLVEK